MAGQSASAAPHEPSLEPTPLIQPGRERGKRVTEKTSLFLWGRTAPGPSLGRHR